MADQIAQVSAATFPLMANVNLRKTSSTTDYATQNSSGSSSVGESAFSRSSQGSACSTNCGFKKLVEPAGHEPDQEWLDYSIKKDLCTLDPTWSSYNWNQELQHSISRTINTVESDEPSSKSQPLYSRLTGWTSKFSCLDSDDESALELRYSHWL